ncbi:MAG: hypothetical protein ABI194_00315 [Gemmatimonadaceae bacterium]
MPKYRDPKSAEAHLYSRTRNGVTRYYGDFRDYANVGGGQESLKIENANGATTDRARRFVLRKHD